MGGALLAFVQGDAGADVVEAQLLGPASCGAVDWAEVAQEVRSAGRDRDLSRALLLGYGLHVEPATQADAEGAAARWRRGEGLSLADRVCLALGERLGVPAVTADTAWGAGTGVVQIR